MFTNGLIVLIVKVIPFLTTSYTELKITEYHGDKVPLFSQYPLLPLFAFSRHIIAQLNRYVLQFTIQFFICKVLTRISPGKSLTLNKIVGMFRSPCTCRVTKYLDCLVIFPGFLDRFKEFPGCFNFIIA